MKKFKKLFIGILALIIGISTLESCQKDNPTPLQAVVDVFIQDIKTDAGVKYGIIIYATSNYEIKSAKVTGPGTDGKVYNLTATTYRQQFVYLPQTADYESVLPAKGDYTFEIISTGNEKITGIEAVGDEKLEPIVIKSSTITNHLLKTTWDKVQNADGYVVRLYSADKSDLLFSSDFISSDKVEYDFGSTTPGWFSGKSPAANIDFVVELQGVKFETGVSYNKGDNIQFITVDSKTITWE